MEGCGGEDNTTAQAEAMAVKINNGGEVKWKFMVVRGTLGFEWW